MLNRTNLLFAGVFSKKFNANTEGLYQKQMKSGEIDNSGHNLPPVFPVSFIMAAADGPPFAMSANRSRCYPLPI